MEHINEVGKKIEIKEGMSGIIICAKSNINHDDWIILVSNVAHVDYDDALRIVRHVSYSIRDKIFRYDSPGESKWGSVRNYTFYEATDEQKITLITKMREHKLKYISILNKIVKL